MDHSSRVLAGVKSRRSGWPLPAGAMRPEPSCTIIHLAMSAADELMPPAGLGEFAGNGPVTPRVPAISPCVGAVISAAAEEESPTWLPSLPTGWGKGDGT